MGTDLAETEEGIVLATAQAGNQPIVPDKNKFENCLSCKTEIQDIYCGNCGQKNDDLRRSLWRLIAESLGGIFSIESRVWQTWGALLVKPGKVASEYANGARTKYSSPIRVYLVISFLFFGFLAVSKTNLFAVSISPSPAKAKELGITLPTNIESENILTLNDYSYEFLFFQPQSVFDEKANAEYIEYAIKDIEAKAKADLDQGNEISISGFTRFLKNPNLFNSTFNTWLPRVMFFMVPIAMILGKMFVRGPTALLYDHLIHSIYIHAVLFSSLLLAILLSKVFSGALAAKIIVVFFAIYLPLSLRRMFKRGWFKTIFTTIFVGTGYSLILIIALTGITTLSFVTNAS